jgi:hypothetical protein
MTNLSREEIIAVRTELVAKGWLEAHGERGGETVWRVTKVGRVNMERELAFVQGEATPPEDFILENPDQKICDEDCDWGSDRFDNFPDLNWINPYRRLDWTGWVFSICTRCGALWAGLMDRTPFDPR